MEYAKKLVLVDPAVLERNTNYPGIVRPALTAICSLDEEMKKILESGETSVESKVRSYNQTLRKYIAAYSKELERPVKVEQVSAVTGPPGEREETATAEPPVPSLETDSVFDDALASVPQKFRRKAGLLLKHLKKQAAWNDKGELMYKQRPVHGTNITDLVNDAVRDRDVPEPPGWEIFGTLLRESNVPTELVSNKDRRYHFVAEGRYELPSPKKPKRKRGVISTGRQIRWSAY
jgi:hypothetical protein